MTRDMSEEFKKIIVDCIDALEHNADILTMQSFTMMMTDGGPQVL